MADADLRALGGGCAKRIARATGQTSTVDRVRNVCCSPSSWTSARRTIRCRSSVSAGGITPIGDFCGPRAGLAQLVRTGGANGGPSGSRRLGQHTRGGACAVSHAACERDGRDTGVVCIQGTPSPRVRTTNASHPSPPGGIGRIAALAAARSTWQPLHRNLALVACPRYGFAAIA
jgi:hypothetical protein